MVQSPSWATNWFAASQQIPRISRNPKVHYRTHRRPPPISILGQPNQLHIPTSHLLEIHPNITHSSRPRSSHWSLSLRFPYTPPSPHLYAPHGQPISLPYTYQHDLCNVLHTTLFEDQLLLTSWQKKWWMCRRTETLLLAITEYRRNNSHILKGNKNQTKQGTQKNSFTCKKHI